MSQTESVLDAVARLWPLWALVALWATAATRRRRHERREQASRDSWMQSHTRGGDPRP